MAAGSPPAHSPLPSSVACPSPSQLASSNAGSRCKTSLRPMTPRRRSCLATARRSSNRKFLRLSPPARLRALEASSPRKASAAAATARRPSAPTRATSSSISMMRFTSEVGSAASAALLPPSCSAPAAAPSSARAPDEKMGAGELRRVWQVRSSCNKLAAHACEMASLIGLWALVSRGNPTTSLVAKRSKPIPSAEPKSAPASTAFSAASVL